MKTEHIDALCEILQDVGIYATEDQIKQIASDFYDHIETYRDMQMEQFRGAKSTCDKYAKLETELKEALNKVRIYHNNVCERRGTNHVWIEGEIVKYRPE